MTPTNGCPQSVDGGCNFGPSAGSRAAVVELATVKLDPSDVRKR